MPAVDRYVGTPWVELGRSFKGCHCYGLAWLYAHNEAKVDLPWSDEVSGSDRRAADIFMTAAGNGDWPEIARADARAFDLVLMTGEHGAPSHIGIMVSATHVLHVERNTAAVCVPLDDRSVRSRLIGFYRYKALA